MKTALVTGGAGFIGSSLIDHLLDRGGWNVVAIDNFDPFYDSGHKRNNLASAARHENFRLIEADITDSGMHRAIPAKIDVIVHLAARAGVRPSIRNPAGYEKVNVGGTVNLLEVAREKGIPQFVFASSSSVYGVNPRFPWREDDPVLDPISPYAATKVAGELLGHVYSRLHGIRFIALRLFTVYGPRQRPDLAIHKFFKHIREGKPIPFYGDGRTSRDYTYIDDIVSGLAAAMEYRGSAYEVINLGNRQAVTLSHLLEVIEKVAGKKAQLDRQPEQPGDVPHTCADTDKARRLLDYAPTTDLETGIGRFSEWYNANR